MAKIRKLFPSDAARLTSHLIRLHPSDRRHRFDHLVKDDVIRKYVRMLDWQRIVVVGLFDDDGQIRAVTELHRLNHQRGEIAVSVERPFQGVGIGATLVRRILTVSRNIGLKDVNFLISKENIRMQKLARRLGSRSQPSCDSMAILEKLGCTGSSDEVIFLPAANSLSIIQEAIDDSSGNISMLLDPWASGVMASLFRPSIWGSAWPLLGQRQDRSSSD